VVGAEAIMGKEVAEGEVSSRLVGNLGESSANERE